MKITLEPKCLEWARKRSDLSTNNLAQKMGVNEEAINTWEQSGEITWSQAEKLASVTNTPFGYLFLSSPPKEQLPIKDFRPLGILELKPSVELLDVVNDALRKQDWFRDYIISNDGEPLSFVGSLKTAEDITGTAKRIREVIGWTAKLRKEATSWENMLSKHIDSVERAGILVMRNSVVGNNSHRTLSVSEFRGFSLADEYAPIIFINNADARSAQLFTLAHELVHIWLGISGVSNLTQTYAPDIADEQFCNAVAAELLVPLLELIEVLDGTTEYRDKIALATHYFRVSSLVIVRRLRDAGFLTQQDFQRLYTDELTQFSQQEFVQNDKNGGSFYRTLRVRQSKRFVSALVKSTFQGETPYLEAYQLLGVKNAEALRRLASTLRTTA